MNINWTNYDIVRLREQVQSLFIRQKCCKMLLNWLLPAASVTIPHPASRASFISFCFNSYYTVQSICTVRKGSACRVGCFKWTKKGWEWGCKKSEIEILVATSDGKQTKKLTGGGKKPSSTKLEDRLLEWIHKRYSQVSCKLIMKKSEIVYQDIKGCYTVNKKNFKVQFPMVGWAGFWNEIVYP